MTKLTLDETRTAFRRLLANGPLTHLPGKPSDLEMLLALAASRFVPGRPCRENEVNEALKAWLRPFCSPEGADHVTMRRNLVDAGYLKRDPAGSAYELVPGKLEATLADDARKADPAEILAEVRRERALRKRGNSNVQE